MKPEIKYLHSPDVDPLEGHEPPDKENFSFLVQIIVGPEGQKGQESFDVLVCSPKRLESNLRDEQILMGRHHLIMKTYDYDRIVRFISDYLDKCSGKDWAEVAVKLGRLGYWEFGRLHAFAQKLISVHVNESGKGAS